MKVTIKPDLWNTPCEYCGLTWLKHPTNCPNYHAIDAARCAVKHSLTLRSSSPNRPEGRYEYECWYCSLPAIFQDHEITDRTHPFCESGRHIWTNPCPCDSCCQGKQFCWCGAIRLRGNER